MIMRKKFLESNIESIDKEVSPRFISVNYSKLGSTARSAVSFYNK